MATILVVDDDAATRSLVRDVLESEGHRVEVVPDGFTALRRVQAVRPDCVVLDVMMPGLDGHTVLDRLRAADGGRDLPVIMLTALTEAGHAWRAWGEGVHCFMTKPFDAAELLDQVDGLVRRRSA